MSHHRTFENFIAGNNSFAYHAMLDMATTLGTYSRVLYINGPSGVGKTHLMAAAVRKLKAENPDLDVVYVSMSQIEDELVEAIRCGQLEAFRNHYLGADILFVDNLERIEYRELAAREFAVFFENMVNQGKQMVIAADRLPEEICGINPHLVQRLRGAVMIGMEYPNTESRIEMAWHYADGYNTYWPDEVYRLIAEGTENGFQILGVVKKLLLWESQSNRRLGPDDAIRILEDSMVVKCYDPVDIMDAVCEEFEVTMEVLTGNARVKNIGKARRVTAYLIRKHSRMDMYTLTEKMNRSFDTVFRWVNDVAAEMQKENSEYRRRIRSVEQILKETCD